MNQHVLPKIAVLLAVYNGKDYLQEQVRSILEQKNVDVTLFVSVDQSTDGSELLVDGIASVSERIVVLDHGRTLGSAASNFFRLLVEVKYNDFDYISFADQDDIWCQDKLCHARELIDKQKVDAYSSNVLAFWSDGVKKIIDKAQPQQGCDYMFESAGPGCTFVLRKDLAIDLQTFLSDNYSSCKDVALHDWFIYAFARTRGYIWHIDKEAHIFYRQHEGNVVGANVGFEAKKERWKKMLEGWHRDQALLIGSILAYAEGFPMGELKRYNILDRLVLIICFRKLRRKFLDSLVLAFYFMISSKK